MTLFVLANHKIRSTLNSSNVMSYDVMAPHVRFVGGRAERPYVMAFRDSNYLHMVKEHSLHPYVVSEMRQADLHFYANSNKTGYVIVERGYCSLENGQTVFEVSRHDAENLDHVQNGEIAW